MSSNLDVSGGEIFTAQDIARVVHRSPATVKRIAAELRLSVLRTVGGYRIFNRDNLQRIQDEVVRREREELQ